MLARFQAAGNTPSVRDKLNNIIFFSLLDSDWLKSVPINP